MARAEVWAKSKLQGAYTHLEYISTTSFIFVVKLGTKFAENSTIFQRLQLNRFTSQTEVSCLVQLTVLVERDSVRFCLCCLSTIVPVRLSKGLACSSLPLWHIVLDASGEFGVMISTVTCGLAANSNNKALQCLRSLSKASNPVTQLEQHSHIS